MRGQAAVGLFQPNTTASIKATIRACQAYEASIMFVSGKRYKRSSLDTGKGSLRLPLFNVDSLHDVIPSGYVPVAVDLVRGARDLRTYTHPEMAFYIFGPEDGPLGNKITSWCRDTVYIPTETYMDLAATVNVVLYDRMSKGIRSGR